MIGDRPHNNGMHLMALRATADPVVGLLIPYLGLVF